MIHTYITDHQRHLSNRSPPALGHSPANPLPVHFILSTTLPPPQATVESAFSCLMKLFLHHTLFPGLSDWTLDVGSFYHSHLRTSLLKTHHLDQVSISNTPSETSAETESPQTARLGWIYEHKQLFKPRLFTDNLLNIQLFILRQRPSPSHKQMKSNKTLVIVKDIHPHYTIKLNIPTLLE